MNYINYKDKKTKDTVLFIKKILSDLGIKTEEDYIANKRIGVSSVCIKIKDTEIGSNGKGINKISCLASGYAEFMERLQLRCLMQGTSLLSSLFTYSDRKFIEHTEIKDSIVFLSFKNKENIEKFMKNSGGSKKVETIPFYSFKDNDVCYLPINLVMFLQGSNGMAAGNTFEEAIVQGLSEVCERFSMKQILQNQIRIPTISEDSYKNYSKLDNIISAFEKEGYKVTVKDASLNKGLPVVCTIFEDIRYPQNGLTFRFGCHPCLPIAIERTLTEVLQGKNIEDKHWRITQRYMKIPDDCSVDNLFVSATRKGCYVNSTNKIISCLISQDGYDYEYNNKANAWINDEIVDNKQLVTKLLTTIRNFSQNIYIRNCSFLNFPTVYILIPEMSTMYDSFINDADKYSDIYNWFINKTIINSENITNLLETCEFLTQRLYIETRLTDIPAEYIGLLCSIILNNENKINLFLDMIIRKTQRNINSTKDQEFFLCLKYYFNQKFKNIPIPQIYMQMEKIYDNDLIEEIKYFVNNITFKNVKLLLSKFKQEKKRSELPDNLKQLKKVLNKQYKRNCPNQTILSKYRL